MAARRKKSAPRRSSRKRSAPYRDAFREELDAYQGDAPTVKVRWGRVAAVFGGLLLLTGWAARRGG